jgi:nucleoside-diphosphate-sugar epimerase
MKILITGATGFIGNNLTKYLVEHSDHSLVSVLRQVTPGFERTQSTVIGDFLPDTDWSKAIHGIDVVIHLAARVHIMRDSDSDPQAAFYSTNTGGTLNLAAQSASSGVRRFIYLSSIKVNGEQTLKGSPFTVDDIKIPDDPYGLSKFEAEVGLRELAKNTDMEVVIIRPPLVYGEGVKGNFLSMLRLIDKGVPLPFGVISNKRSLIGINNLVDLIYTCIDHSKAANKTFLASDGEDLSTTELFQRLGLALGKPNKLLPVPQFLLEAGLTLMGKKAIAQRLCGFLQVDISNTNELLGWEPPFSVDEELQKTAQAFLSSKV